jgi:hypothetical protein
MLRFALTILVLIAAASAAHAQTFVRATAEPVRVCPATPGQDTPPDFAAEGCETMSYWDLDPQGRSLWFEARFTLTPEQIAEAGPKGVYMSGIVASRFFLNGEYIGSNGAPAATPAAEIPGRMDAVTYAPQALLREGENRLAVQLSSHHGRVTLSAPLHMLGLGPYQEPTARILQAYWPSLMMVSVFALSALVFGVMAVRSEDKEGPAILSALSLFLGLMLLSETARGLFAYPYPMHAWRLMAITGFGWAAGAAFLAHVLQRFSGWSLSRRWLCVAAGAGLIALPTVLADGFDGKTGYALLTAFTLATLGCGYWAYRQQPGAVTYVVGLIAAVAMIPLTGHLFLDVHLYWISAAFLFALFVRQALALVRERRARVQESERANRLDAALAQARQASAPAPLKLVSGARTEFVSTDEILSLNGAGDYVELRFKSGRTALHNATLTELEKALPAAFLRVHRSCIVNTAFVERLERDAGGGGRLTLAGGGEAPVSRRIMPKVKTVLEEGAT